MCYRLREVLPGSLRGFCGCWVDRISQIASRSEGVCDDGSTSQLLGTASDPQAPGPKYGKVTQMFSEC